MILGVGGGEYFLLLFFLFLLYHCRDWRLAVPGHVANFGGKILKIMALHCHWPESSVTFWREIKKSGAKDCNWLLSCQGLYVQSVIEALRKSNETRSWTKVSISDFFSTVEINKKSTP